MARFSGAVGVDKMSSVVFFRPYSGKSTSEYFMLRTVLRRASRFERKTNKYTSGARQSRQGKAHCTRHDSVAPHPH